MFHGGDSLGNVKMHLPCTREGFQHEPDFFVFRITRFFNEWAVLAILSFALCGITSNRVGVSLLDAPHVGPSFVCTCVCSHLLIVCSAVRGSLGNVSERGFVQNLKKKTF